MMRPDTTGADQAPFERIKPVDPTVGTRAADYPAPAQPSRKSVPATIVVGSLSLVLVLAFVAFVYLPRGFSPARQSHEDSAVKPIVPVEQAPPVTSPSPKPAPWDDPALLRARQAAQQAADRFANRAEVLRGQTVQRWAAAEFAAAGAEAEAGARAFEQHDFNAALNAYREGLAKLDALTARAKQELAKALTTGAEALTHGDRPTAAAAFDLALAMAPDDAAARRGQARVQTLDAVMAKIESGGTAERAGNLEAAAAGYRAALVLDADMTPARTALARVETARAEQHYQHAVAEGLAALERSDFDAAEQAFSRARKVHPDAAAVTDGLARVQNARRDRRITELREQAQASERAEDWNTAVERYRAALALDQTLSFAREGLTRSGARARLANRIQFFIENPQRLYTETIYAEAATLLEEARKLAVPGPVLTRQINALAQGLQVAATPLSVRLQSDNITEVMVYKVGSLGRFESKELRLKPGRYVAVGACPGYRDVRREFEVTPDAPAGPIVVRCKERI